jgi:hypothetical protein
LQGVERVASLVVLPHPERDAADVRNLRPDPETEAIAMRFAMDHERADGRTVDDVHERNLGYDITSIDPQSGELRLIEIKGLAGASGTVALTPHEKEVAQDRPDCYWLYVVTDCKAPGGPKLQPPVRNPARLPWREVRKVDYYSLSVEQLAAATDREGGAA